jgi:hypothetical protein
MSTAFVLPVALSNMAFSVCYDGNSSFETLQQLTDEAWSSSELGTEYRINGIILAVTLTIFLIIGTSLNLTVIISIVRKKLHLQPTFLLLLSLSITDVLFCVTVMPFNVVTGFAGEFLFGSSDVVRCRVCKVGAMLSFLSLLSLHSVALIAVDRLLFIKRPLRYHKIVTVPRILSAMLVVWSVCILMSILPFLGIGEINYSHALFHCTLDFTTLKLYIFLIVGEALVPLLTLIISSLWVACIAWRHLKLVYKTPFGEQQDNAAHQRVKKRKSKLQFHLVRVFSAIIIANILTWVPILILGVVATFVDEFDIPIWYKTFSYLCFLFQPVLHPVLETSLISEIRFPILKTMSSGWHQCLSTFRKTDCWRCALEVGCNGLRVGVVNGVCECRACGILDMCSAAALILADQETDLEEIDNPVSISQTGILN